MLREDAAVGLDELGGCALRVGLFEFLLVLGRDAAAGTGELSDVIVDSELFEEPEDWLGGRALLVGLDGLIRAVSKGRAEPTSKWSNVSLPVSFIVRFVR